MLITKIPTKYPIFLWLDQRDREKKKKKDRLRETQKREREIEKGSKKKGRREEGVY